MTSAPCLPGPGSEVEIMVERLGGLGDGLASLPDGRVAAIAHAAPGDRVRVRLGEERDGIVGSTLREVVKPGPARADPPCPQFGPCGGCRLQHLADPIVAAWKRDRILVALARVGINADAVTSATIVSPRRSRRRAVFAGRRGRSRVFLGFNEERSHRIVDIDGCAVLSPPLLAARPALATALADILPESAAADVAVTLLDDGLDVVVSPEKVGRLDLSMRERLAHLAEEVDLARLWWGTPRSTPEPIALRRDGIVDFGGHRVVAPPAPFLQATREGELALAGEVSRIVGDAARIADLYSGIGTFSLRLAGRASVHAFEGDRPAVDALSAAVRRAGSGLRLLATRRDLARDPLAVDELDRFDAVILDPPRIGAAAQSMSLARSRVPVVAAVSCNPATFARDAAVLVEGGYQLERIVPVDQFLWSTHVELIAAFRRRYAQ